MSDECPASRLFASTRASGTRAQRLLLRSTAAGGSVSEVCAPPLPQCAGWRRVFGESCPVTYAQPWRAPAALLPLAADNPPASAAPEPPPQAPLPRPLNFARSGQHRRSRIAGGRTAAR